MSKLAIGLGLAVGLEDPRLRLHDLAQRPEGDALAIGQASPPLPPHGAWASIENRLELVEKPALPGTRLTHHGDQLSGVGGDGPVQ